MLTKLIVGAAIALGVNALSVASASAVTFAVYTPTNSTANLQLSGTTLSSTSPVVFDFKVPALAALGDLTATYSLSATETGALAFGPATLATFDGSFSLTYAGATVTAGSVTVHNGDNLLSGSFLGALFTGFGSTGTFQDSISSGGLVAFTSNFIAFNPLSDEALSLALTSLNPLSQVVAGQLTPFTAVSSGTFAADIQTLLPTPLPSTWTMLLSGVAGLGFLMFRRKNTFAAIAA